MIDELQKNLSYRFSNIELLKEALTHPSYAHEHGLEKDNERLEFLGDAVISLVVTEYLLNQYPERKEGELALIRARLVSRGTLAYLADKIGMGPFLLLGNGDNRQGVREKKSTLANVFEAIVGAIYLDGGLEEARKFLLPLFELALLELRNSSFKMKDPKTELQEILQGKFRDLPKYELVSVEGPSHAPTFRVKVLFRGQILGFGVGKSRKEAEKDAAEKALEAIKSAIIE
ncbi:MAG: ribonuclease III [Synergistetes bacterium]|nr:ribonuclease III [Synergistota bacterium]MCX8127800.1 ribonuclease III [Synergistota bacterium]MDW8192062.1 ribonuclease III [Synergistota bacterium]